MVKENKDKKNLNSKKVVDTEPNWYHYLIVIIIFLILFYLVYYSFNFFSPNYKKSANIRVNFYNYPYTVGNVTYNIQFSNPIDIIKNTNYKIQVNKIDLLNSLNLTMAFYNYSGDTNGYVGIVASKISSFLSQVYFLKFNNNQFTNISNCSTSNISSKVIMFNPNSSINGILYNKSNGCIQVLSTNATNIVMVGDKLIYNLIKS